MARVVVVGRVVRKPSGGVALILRGDSALCGFERQTVVYPFSRTPPRTLPGPPTFKPYS